MLEYNLTQRERQLLIQLFALSKQSKDYFEAQVLHPLAKDGPTRELTRVKFETDGGSLDLTRRDLHTLKDEGLIHFRWDQPALGTGRLSSLAFEAVHTKFQQAADELALEVAADKLAVIADEKAIAQRFEKITADLVNLASQLIDADEALSAQREALSIAHELSKEHPDETVTIRKIKGFVSRLSLTFSGTADLAMKGSQIGEFAERLAAWLVALSVWTEWHASHHPAPHPPVPAPPAAAE